MKLGIAVPNLGPTQLSYYLIRNANQCLKEGGLDFLAFYEVPTVPAIPLDFASMLVGEAWDYDGTLVATTLNTAAKIAASPSALKRFFYVWDLEWVRPGAPKDFGRLSALYRDERYDLIARSGEHKQAIEEAWNRPVRGVVEDFNFEQLLGIIGD